MNSHQHKIVGEGLTYDDVLLVPAFSEILPEKRHQTKFTRNISITFPLFQRQWIQENCYGNCHGKRRWNWCIHKNMTIEEQAHQVRKVKELSGMIIDPVTLPLTSVVDNQLMREHKIGGIPLVDDHGTLQGIVTNRDLRFEILTRPIAEVMTSKT